MAKIRVSTTEAPRVRAGAGGVIEDGSLTVTDVATASLVSGSFVWGWFLHIRGVHDLKRPIRFCDAEFWVLYEGTTQVGPYPRTERDSALDPA